MIKMLQASNEANIIQEINEIIAGIEHGDDNPSFRLFGEMDLLSIFHSHNRFANSLFEGVDLQFIPLYVITRLGIRHFNITRNNYTSYKEFIKNSFKLYKGKRVTNGPIEGINSRVKSYKKLICGYKDYERFYERVIYVINSSKKGKAD